MLNIPIADLCEARKYYPTECSQRKGTIYHKSLAIEEIRWFVIHCPISPSPGDAALSIGRVEDNERVYGGKENCLHCVSYHRKDSNKRRLLPT